MKRTSDHCHTTLLRRGAPLLFFFAFSAASYAAPILWNKLGGTNEVLQSAYGPNLTFYAGGSGVDTIATPAFVPGVFGNGLSIGPGSYSVFYREHNVIWTNVDHYLNPDHGTIEMWYQQQADPVDYSYGVYRLFDGAYGLNTGIGLASLASPAPALYFSIDFGGASSSVSCNVAAYNGTWIHVAAVWDRAGIAGSSDTLRLYTNGVVAAASSAGGWGSTVGPLADIGGGNDGNIAGKFAIDNLQVFDSAKTNFSSRFNETIEGLTQLNIRVSEVEISWLALAGITYQPQYRDDLTANLWVNLGGPVVGGGSTIDLRDPIPSGAPRRFYRVITVP
jgi:hypothetical protein